MKNYLLLFLFSFVTCVSAHSQVPDAFNYQAVVRNSSGEIISNQNVAFRISILQNSDTGPAVYVETHQATTNKFGLVNLEIGHGTVKSGVFTPGGWTPDKHFIKIEFDPTGGNSFTQMGTSQLLAVPYAFQAKTAEIDNVDDADADPNNEIQALQLSGTQLSLSKNGGTVTLPSSGGGDNWGTQTVKSDATLSGKGTTADPLAVVGDLTDDQTLSLAGNDLSISEGNTVTLPTSPWTPNPYGIGYFNNVGIGGGYAQNIKFFVYSPLSTALSATASAETGTTYAGKFITNSPDGYSGHFTGGKFYVSGNVGIGTETPTSLLDLNSHANNAYLTFHTDNASADGLIVGLKNSTNAAYFFNYENAPIYFGTNSNTQMTIDKSGNVGIGNATPMHKLQIADGDIQLDEGKGLRISNTNYYSIIKTAGNDLGFYTFSDGDMVFSTSPTSGAGALERVKITSTGNVGIGVGLSTPSSKLDVNGVIRASGITWPSSGAGVEIAYDASVGRGYIQSYDRTTSMWKDLVLGGLNVYPVKNNSASLGTTSNKWTAVYATNGTIQTSDRRLKKDIKDLNYGLNKIIQLRPVSYRWKKGQNELHLGLIAQEVQKVIPEVVDVGDDKIKTLGMKYTDLIPVLINAIKEQQKIINSQTTKIDGLTAEVAQLKNMDQRLRNLEEVLKTAQK